MFMSPCKEAAAQHPLARRLPVHYALKIPFYPHMLSTDGNNSIKKELTVKSIQR